MTRPTPDQQIAFLTNIQRLLGEGSFVATYKHALLLALADLAVELGDDSGGPLALPISSVAERIVIYYWRQTIPYPSNAGPSSILKQSTGRQAAIVTSVGALREQTGGSLVAARNRRTDWTRLVADVAGTVNDVAFWRLRGVGGGDLDILQCD